MIVVTGRIVDVIFQAGLRKGMVPKGGIRRVYNACMKRG